MFAKNADFTQADNQNVSESNGLATNGQLWIGTTAVNAGGTHINVNTLTAGTGVSITNGPGTITIGLSGGGVAVEHLTGNTGGQLNPDGSNNFNIITANTTVKFAGSGSTITEDFGLTNLILGSNSASITSAARNVGLGLTNLNPVTSGTDNTAIGYNALKSVTTSSLNTAVGSFSQQTVSTGATGNTSIGYASLSNNTGVSNTALGYSSLSTCSTGTNNVGVGSGSLSAISTGTYNIGIGSDAFSGISLTLTDSSNIIIGNSGISGDNNKIRIGTQGAGAGQQNTCFIAGIASVSTANSQMVTVNTSTGQLGSSAITPASTFVWSVITANQTAAINNGYICNKGSTLVLALPATASVGDVIEVTGINTALGWQISQAANQQIFFGTTSTTLGVGGTLTSSQIRDSVRLVCVVSGASTRWNVISSIGSPTVV